LNLILENVGDPILVTDEDANIILMNRQAERLFEDPETESNTGRRREVRANDTRFSSLISDFALSADSTRVETLELIDPEAHAEFPVEIVSGKILNERGEMTAIVSIIHDLTKVVENERLAAELGKLNEGLEGRIGSATEELEERNRRLEWQSRELERAYCLKSEFLASMSHELRTPINALLGYTSLMRDRIYGELSERQDEALDRMYAASQHLLELVNDILDLAKIEAGKMPVHLERVSLGALMAELSQTIEPMVRQKELAFRTEVEPTLPELETDRTKVKQIVLNLLSNAVKFTHQGTVSLVARGTERGVEISVVDTGIGIAEPELEHIFEDFRQVDQSSTREYGGTGLGLSITKKLLNLLGGTIRVESCPGDGSTFTIWLPLQSREVRVDEDAALLARHGDDPLARGSVTT
ncbi:MAG: ATP-binding protein, partial [Gemmatimonadota bacterium]|nr:ATP-binding protein [Gemmatimonadota bacterium]